MPFSGGLRLRRPSGRSCRRYRLGTGRGDTFAYLRDLLTRLPARPQERLDDLLPDRWTPPESADATTRAAGLDDAEPVT